MKKIFKMMMAVVAGVAALTACTNEPEEGVTPDNTQEYCIVKVGMSDVTKGSLTDAEGIKWEVGDQIKYASGAELVSEALTAEDIEDDGYTANFKFAASLNEVDRTGWFVSTKCHPSNYNEVEFTLGADYGNVYSQAVAGEMNSRYLFLHSGTGLVNITQGEAPVVNMDIAGAIFRIMPYTETYSNEVVKSVELKSNNGKHIVGTVAYDRGGGTYTSANEVAGSGWKAYPFVRISLDEPFALTNANSRENSKGIYMAIARTTETHPIEGYTYTVKTDKATYTFSSDNNLVVGENEFKNVYLKLENGVRVDDTVQKGDLRYVGDLNNASSIIPYTGCTDKDGGYWFAETKDSGSDSWVKKVDSANVDYYSSVEFECIDNATGEEADWLTVVYGGTEGCHWMIAAEAQEEGAAERSATVTATFPEFVNGYYTVDECKTKTVTVTQMEYSATKILTRTGGNLGNQTIPAEGGDKIATGSYAFFSVNGEKAIDWENDSHNEQFIYGNMTFVAYVEGTGVGAGATVADWITIGYGRDENNKINSEYIFINAEPNTANVARNVNVLCTYAAPDGYLFETGTRTHQFLITQEAYSAEIVATLTNAYAETVSYEGNDITVGTLALTADGEGVADANEFCNVAINGGASVVLAANGTITATIPANASNSAKEYTVTIKDKSGNTLVADVTINQEANPEGGEVVEPNDVYTYNVEPVQAWGSGWGFPANTVHGGNYAFIRNAAKNGETLYFDGVNVVENPGEVAAELVAMAFVSSAPTDEEKAAFGMQGKTASATAITARARWYGGVQIDVAFTTTDANSITKVTGYAGDGTELGYWIIWTD